VDLGLRFWYCRQEEAEMRKSTLGLLVLIALVSAGGASAQTTLPDLTPLYEELGVVLDQLGRDTLPHLQQFGLMMDGSGKAEIGKGLFLSLSAGAAFLPGIATFRVADPSPFEFLNFDGLLAPLLGTFPAGVKGIYDDSASFFLDPGLRVSAGFALAQGVEVWGHFGIFPNVVGMVAGLVPSLEALGAAEVTRMNAGGRVRLVLVHDQKALPAVSLGVGYTYTQFRLSLPGVGSLLSGGIEIAPGLTLGLDGDLNALTRLHTAGVELNISKKLLFVAPFMRFGAWYQWARYEAGIDGFAMTLGGEPLPGTDALAPVTLELRDLSFVAAGGIELVLGKAGIILQGSYNTASKTPAASATLQFRI
jgi:hypothetical protein